jgi:D-arabinose 1-dehydrogenase-like Zn-dependent alcohol dehydrogenase
MYVFTIHLFILHLIWTGGSELIDGSTDAEYCTLRTEATVRIPNDADPAEYAPLLCAGVTVFNGIRKMGIVPGDVVAIQGLGGLGHLAVQYARKLGYRTVALSTSAKKKDFAHQLGATDYVDTSKESAAEALQKMGGASLIVVTAPNPEVMGPLVAGLGPLGKLLILARELMKDSYLPFGWD